MRDPTEEWRDVVGFEGYYQISSLGRVKKIKAVAGARAGKILKNVDQGHGYPFVSLWRDGNGVGHRIHRLVARAFLGKPPTKSHEVAHFDGNRANPCVSNLRWATRSENHADKLRHGTSGRGERHGASKLTNAQAREILRLHRNGAKRKHLALKFGIHIGTLGKLLSGESWAWLRR